MWQKLPRRNHVRKKIILLEIEHVVLSCDI